MEYWELIENPKDETYQDLIKLLCDYSDTFYFVSRKELKYNQEILAMFEPFVIETYQTKKWSSTETKGPAATVHVIEASHVTCRLLQQLANSLYDWVAPSLPEDLTFKKNDFAWFSCSTHEEFGGFSIRSDYYRKLLGQVPGLKIAKVD